MNSRVTESIARIILARDPNRFWEFIRERLKELVKVKEWRARNGVLITSNYEPYDLELIRRIVEEMLKPHKQAVQVTWPEAVEEIVAAYDGRALLVREQEANWDGE